MNDVARWLDANGGCLQPRCLDARLDANLDANLDAKLDAWLGAGSMQARCLEAGAQDPNLALVFLFFKKSESKYFRFHGVSKCIKILEVWDQNTGPFDCL